MASKSVSRSSGRRDLASDVRILLDTSVAIALRDGDRRLLARQERSAATGLISAVTLVELEGGVGRSEIGRAHRRAALDAIYQTVEAISFTAREAQFYGAIVASLGFARGKIADRMIAATALASDVPLATLNPRDFREIDGLQLEDWSA
jgi:tRNA(fMet)-specific endonuclease VapC